MLKPCGIIAFWIGCTLTGVAYAETMQTNRILDRLLNGLAQVPQKPCPSSGLQPVIVYFVRGGQTGASSEWSLFQDGLVCSADQLAGRLSSDSVRRLLDEILAAGFFNLKDNYRDGMAAKLCHQCNYYKITVQSGDKRKTVETHDGAGNVPLSLWQINLRIQQALKPVR